MSHSSVIAALFIVMSLSRVALLLPGVLQCSPKCHSVRSGIRTLYFSSMHNWLIRCADAPTTVVICACAVVVSGISEQRKSLQRFVHHGTLNTAHVCQNNFVKRIPAASLSRNVSVVRTNKCPVDCNVFTIMV